MPSKALTASPCLVLQTEFAICMQQANLRIHIPERMKLQSHKPRNMGTTCYSHYQTSTCWWGPVPLCHQPYTYLFPRSCLIRPTDDKWTCEWTLPSFLAATLNPIEAKFLFSFLSSGIAFGHANCVYTAHTISGVGPPWGDEAVK